MKFDKTLIEEELSVVVGLMLFGENKLVLFGCRYVWYIFFVVFFFLYIYINFSKMWGLYSYVKHESVALNQENSRL
jgi:hypothetical protein